MLEGNNESMAGEKRNGVDFSSLLGEMALDCLAYPGRRRVSVNCGVVDPRYSNKSLRNLVYSEVSAISIA